MRANIARKSAVVACLFLTGALLSGCDENAGVNNGANGADAGSATPSDSSAAGATGDHPREGTGFTADPCSLLTDDEVSQAIGHQVKALPSSDEKMCEWTVGGAETIDSAYLNYEISPFSRDVLRDLKRPNPGPQYQRVDIGNGALLNAKSGEIHVTVGDSVFRIGSSGPGTPMSPDALTTLGKAAQSRVH